MTQAIIFKNHNGGVSVCIPCEEARRNVLVSEAVTQTKEIPAVIDEEGVEISPAYSETVIISPAVYRRETHEEFLAWVKAKDTPEDSIIVDTVSLPEADNDFFDSWELVNGGVTVNLSKAKEQTKMRLRAERAPLLVAQDVLFQRALEVGGDTKSIVAEKERLRNITQLADIAETTEALRAIHC